MTIQVLLDKNILDFQGLILHFSIKGPK